ncbi:cbb3-type cytochrome oxidase subunit 3 [Thiobacter aerophilum]|uniref:Cbb3-type cytochrome c oxidase subunit 3 n=1 Tax=Thiobacter aerophilum TaxID=3121275 RepID=A0ABV0EHV8_9BURK
MLEWLSHPENTKPLGLLIFFVAFLGILWFVFGSRKRGQKLESYKDIPFLDEESEQKGAQDDAPSQPASRK